MINLLPCCPPRFGHSKTQGSCCSPVRADAQTKHMSSTPRAKPMVAKEAPSPRASKPAAGDKAKKKKPKGSAAPSAPVAMDVPMDKPASLSEEKAKEQLEGLQTKYAALVVNFNNQQEELKHCQAELKKKEDELDMFKDVQAKTAAGDSGAAEGTLQAQLEQSWAVSGSPCDRCPGSGSVWEAARHCQRRRAAA